MMLSKLNQSPAAVANVRQRRAKLIKSFNKRQCKKYLQMYAIDATLYDPDLPLISGMKSLNEYFTELFRFASERHSPKMELRSKRTLVKGKFIYDIGEYSWSTMRCGRYVHIWEWINDDYYLISDRFTIENVSPSLLHVSHEDTDSNDENECSNS